MATMTIEYRDTDLDIDYDIDAGQKLVLHADPDLSQEGFDAQVYLNEIKIGGNEISGLFDLKMSGELKRLVLARHVELAEEFA